VSRAAAAPPVTGGETPTPYDRSFFDEETASSAPSARAIVELLCELIHPTSVVDVGCGTGAFLRTFRDRGVADLVGVEGPWVADAPLLVDRSSIVLADLTHPVELGRRFDLAVCLEVAEHLDAPFADGLVDLLVRLAPVVAFSAAPPLQTGTHHVNLRWPEYWARKFRGHGYVPVDALRARLAERPGVFQFYVQNILLYVDGTRLRPGGALAGLAGDRVRWVPIYLFSPGNPRMSRFLNRAPPPAREALYLALKSAGII
jgi:SAM-dependent methyltransferase